MLKLSLLCVFHATPVSISFTDGEARRHPSRSKPPFLCTRSTTTTSSLPSLEALVEVGVEQVEVGHVESVLLLQVVDTAFRLLIQRLQTWKVVPSSALGVMLQALDVFVVRRRWKRQLRDAATIIGQNFCGDWPADQDGFEVSRDHEPDGPDA